LRFIPAAIKPYIRNNLEQWIPELRVTTVLFVSLGLNMVDLRDQEGINHAQKVLVYTQTFIY